jgi:hypothetical protein
VLSVSNEPFANCLVEKSVLAKKPSKNTLAGFKYGLSDGVITSTDRTSGKETSAKTETSTHEASNDASM